MIGAIVKRYVKRNKVILFVRINLTKLVMT